MIKPIIVEYKYDDNIVEIILRDKKDCILYKYEYEYNKNNLIDNCKFYEYKSDGSCNCCNNIIFDRDNNNITKVFINNVLEDEIFKNNNEYEIKSYSLLEDYEDLNSLTIMFFNDHIDKYLYINGDKKCGLESYCANYFDKNNRLIKNIYSNKNLEKSKTTYGYDDKNRIIKKIKKSYEKNINYIDTTTEIFKYDEDSNIYICNRFFKSGNNTEASVYNLVYNANTTEHINFNTLESQQLLAEYGETFLTYTNYLLLNPYNRDIGSNFKYDNQSRVISKEVILFDLDMD